MRSIILRVPAALLVLFMMIGCGAKNPANSKPATPFEQVMLWNQGLAEANDGIARAIIGLTSVQPPLIDTANAKNILTWQFRIAAADKKLTAILEQGPAYASGQASQINDLITEISAGSTALTNAGTLGISNPQSQTNINGLIAGLSGLAKLLVTGLQAAGVLKAELQCPAECKTLAVAFSIKDRVFCSCPALSTGGAF